MRRTSLRRPAGNPFAQPNLKERRHIKAPPTPSKAPPIYLRFLPSPHSPSPFPTQKLW